MDFDTDKILLVDDEEGIRKVLGISLADMGYTVYFAENGEQALSIFKEKQPAIVLTDIKMPGMDGIEVLRRIKAENPDAEVIVITGHGDMDLAIKSLKYEATDFITKPIDDDELEKALRKSKNRIFLRLKLKQYTENLEKLVQEKTQRLNAASGGEEDIQTSRRYESLFNQMPGYVALVTRDLKIASANRQFKEDFRFSEGDDVFCHQLLRHSDNPCPDCPALKTFETGETRQAEKEYKGPDGARYNVLSWTTPLRDEAGGISRVMIMATDITQIMDLQDHLSSLGLMIGSLSHGIKGLLTNLDGGVYLLDSGFSKDDPEKINEGLDIVKLMVGRIKSMVLDILYYAKERELQKAPVDMAEFAEDLAKVIKAKTDLHGIEFTHDVAPDISGQTVEADRDQLHTAMVNILENAVDACAEDRSKGEHHIALRVRRDADGVVIDVEDDGVGMAPEVREKIFTLFYSSKAARGTGIGLFVTLKIIQQHGGRIDVSSEPGKGTVFSVILPASVA